MDPAGSVTVVVAPTNILQGTMTYTASENQPTHLNSQQLTT